MILSKEKARQKLQIEDDFKYTQVMFLDIEHIDYRDDILKMEWGIEVLNQLNMIERANKLFEDLGSNRKIDASILYEVLKAIYEGNPFDNEFLVRYFYLTQSMEGFLKPMMKWHNIDSYYLPFEVEYLLLGLPIEKMVNNELDDIGEKYGEVNCKMRFGEMEIKDFIERSKALIDMI